MNYDIQQRNWESKILKRCEYFIARALWQRCGNAILIPCVYKYIKKWQLRTGFSLNLKSSNKNQKLFTYTKIKLIFPAVVFKAK